MPTPRLRAILIDCRRNFFASANDLRKSKMNRAGRYMADADAVLQHVVIVVLVPADRRAAGASPHHVSNEACGCSQCMCGTQFAGLSGSELIAMAAVDETDPKPGAHRTGVKIPTSGAPTEATRELSSEAAKPRPPA